MIFQYEKSPSGKGRNFRMLKLFPSHRHEFTRDKHRDTRAYTRMNMHVGLRIVQFATILVELLGREASGEERERLERVTHL